MNSETALERLNYYHGQLLSASELQAEQDYFLARLRRHNRYLHGWGVVSGLAVSMASSSEIVVEPGFAIDCLGNEIHVCKQSRLKVPSAPELQFVVVEYSETRISPVPVFLSAEDPAGEALAFTRILEGFRIDIVDIDPTTDHRGQGAGTPGCGCDHPVCIASLRKSRRSWKVEQLGRRV
ncbi:MAG: hypothetical protein FIA94_01135 [Nitrospirae bacterium]|nr:hypothetical protein [Nitrospirota bacterium]